MHTKEELLRVAKEYFNIENIKEICPINTGHINETYEVRFDDCRYVLQQLNHHVFLSPFSVKNNIDLITEHIRTKCVYDGRSLAKSSVNYIKSRYNQTLVVVNNEYWRCMEYVEGGKTSDEIVNKEMFEEAGKAVGDFQYLLSDFHTRLLDDTIPFFHDTQYRYEQFLQLLEENKDSDRVKETEKEIEFIKNHSDLYDYIISRVADQTFPRRVCHNDTKMSNIMLDKKTGKFMCLIDLDTVMKGSLLFDYGDAVRMGASTVVEDENDLSKVGVNLEMVEAFTRGFLYELRPRNDKEYITPAEVNSLYYGILIISLELGMRFLHDYINGDVYFRINGSNPKQNLDRARCQLKFAEKVEEDKEAIEAIIEKVKKELGYEA